MHAYAIKNIGTFWTKHRAPKHLHPNFPEPSWIPEPHRLCDYLHGKPPQPHQVSASEPSKTSQGTVSVPKPSGTSPATCTLTFWNLPAPEPCATSLAICNKPSETSPGICTGIHQNLTICLQWNPPEPQHGICEVPAICTGNPPEPHQVSAPEPPKPHQVSAPESPEP